MTVVVVDSQGNTVKSPGEVLTMAKLEDVKLAGILKTDPATFTVTDGYAVRLKVEREFVPIVNVTGLNAIPTSLVDSETTPTFLVANVTPAPERKDTPVADKDVPISPAFSADKRLVWKV